MNIRMENLTILQDFVPYRGLCLKGRALYLAGSPESSTRSPGTKGTCLGPRASGGPVRPLEAFLCFIEVLKRKRKRGGGTNKKEKEKRKGDRKKDRKNAIEDKYN